MYINYSMNPTWLGSNRCFVHESLREIAEWLMSAENSFSVIQTKAE
ncbi:hypothetical protein ACIQZI_15380 [Peribacillus sp. NPDC096379]